MKIEQVIQKAIEGLIELPKRATIKICRFKKNILRGIKGGVLHLYERVMLAVFPTRGFSSLRSSATTYATDTFGTLNSTDISSAIKRLEKDSKLANLSGLAKGLGITKEGVQRLIWSLGDAQRIKGGLELSSLEMTSLVKSAILKELILKQTTTLLGSRPSLTKKESSRTKQLSIVAAYGIRTMDEPFVGNVTGTS